MSKINSPCIAQQHKSDIQRVNQAEDVELCKLKALDKVAAKQKLDKSYDTEAICKQVSKRFPRKAASSVEHRPASALQARLSQTKKQHAKTKAVRIDTNAHPEIRQPFIKWLNSRDETRFPHLSENRFEAVSPASAEYNCFAHAVGIDFEWVDPGSTMLAHTFHLKQKKYAPMTELDFSLEDGMQKVVIYGKKPGDDGYDAMLKYEDHYFSKNDDKALITHAIVQEADGGWTSKMGRLATIKISDPNVLNGYNYGKPLRVFIRPRK